MAQPPELLLAVCSTAGVRRACVPWSINAKTFLARMLELVGLRVIVISIMVFQCDERLKQALTSHTRAQVSGSGVWDTCFLDDTLLHIA